VEIYDSALTSSLKVESKPSLCEVVAGLRFSDADSIELMTSIMISNQPLSLPCKIASDMRCLNSLIFFILLLKIVNIVRMLFDLSSKQHYFLYQTAF
jgi:hypothetical protein